MSTAGAPPGGTIVFPTRSVTDLKKPAKYTRWESTDVAKTMEKFRRLERMKMGEKQK